MKLEDKTILDIQELKKLISEERAAQRAIEPSFLLESPEELDELAIRKEIHAFKAIYLFGPAGSGKTFISDQVGLPKEGDSRTGFRTVNPDQRIEDVFPSFGVSMKFASGEGNEELEALQQGMRNILQNASEAHTNNLILTAKPLIFDTTGEDVPKMTKRIKSLQKLGYKVGVLMVNVPPDVSVDRDNKRARTVGADRTRKISTDYQEAVVQARGYFQALSGTGAVILGGDIYPNLFNLKTNTLLKGITDEHVKAMGNPTPEGAKSLLDNIRKDLQVFLSNDDPLPAHGQAIKNGMERLVKLSGGEQGQNMLDIEKYWSDAFREKYPKIVGDPAIEGAAKYLAWLGGESPPKKDKQGKKDKEDYRPNSPAQNAASGANRSRKNTGNKSIRDRTGNRNPTKVGSVVPGTVTDDEPQGRKRRFESEQKTVADIIRAAVLEIKKEMGD